MKQDLLENVLEAALMVAHEPLSVPRLLTLFADDPDAPGRDALRSALDALQQRYQARGIELKEVASGFRFQVRPDYAEWIKRLFEEKPQRYSRALLETLAIIAYRQPLTRGEIEDIRGVSISASIVRTLQEREWVRVVGQRDVPGRPELLATTRQFLDYFNLKRLADLPSLSAIKDFDQLNPDLFADLDEKAAPTGQGAAEIADALADAKDSAAGAEEADVTSGAQDDTADNVIPFSGGALHVDDHAAEQADEQVAEQVDEQDPGHGR